MTILTESRKAPIIAAGTLAVLVLGSYIASVILYLYSGLDPDLAGISTVWHYIGDPVFNARAFGSLAVGYGIFPTLALWYFMGKNQVAEKQIGGNRWATWQDICKAGLNRQHGIILGKYKKQYIVSDSDTHTIIVAPTRSGKGVGFVIPNLLAWKGSVLCLDIKQENFEKTAGFRQAHGHEVYFWAPMDTNRKSHCYNPLDAISRDPHKIISDVQDIGWILIPDPTYGDKFWASEARALFAGLVLYVLENPEIPSTLGAVNRLLGAEADLGDICRHIVKTHEDILPSGGQKMLMSFANKAVKERSGVKSNLDEALYLWTDPAIDAVTSKSDFSLADLRKKKMAVYIGVPTGAIEKLSPLLRIFFEQTANLLSMKLPDETEPFKVLMLIDEFHMLGKMNAIKKSFTLMAGYGFRIMAVVQGLKWLDIVYGRDESEAIVSGCAHQIFFAPNDNTTAAYVSKTCGEKIVETTTISKKMAWKYEPASKNTGRAHRPLISASEMRILPPKEQIMIVEGHMPVRAKKIAYYKDKNFANRLLPPPDIPSVQIQNYKIPKFNLTVKKPADKKPEPESAQMEMPLPDISTDEPRLNDLLDETPTPSSEAPVISEGFADSLRRALGED